MRTKLLSNYTVEWSVRKVSNHVPDIIYVRGVNWPQPHIQFIIPIILYPLLNVARSHDQVQLDCPTDRREGWTVSFTSFVGEIPRLTQFHIQPMEIFLVKTNVVLLGNDILMDTFYPFCYGGISTVQLQSLCTCCQVQISDSSLTTCSIIFSNIGNILTGINSAQLCVPLTLETGRIMAIFHCLRFFFRILRL